MWALKYRPKTFEEVIGQESAVEILKKSVGHATTFILYGESGVGKTTLARIFANHVNGEVIEINGATNNGVDDVRGLLSSATYQPAFNDYRVFIIDECHMLTTQAWNALLKVLEESPKTTLWLLCTTEFSKIPQTIKSRSVIAPLKRIENDAMQAHLEHILALEKCEIPSETLGTLQSNSEGRMREAITALETYCTTGELADNFTTSTVLRLVTAVFRGERKYVAKTTADLTNERIEKIVQFINDYLKLLILRSEFAQTTSTEQILREYTSISPANLDQLRVLQDAVWKCVPTGKPQVEGSIELMYELFSELMKHYNDFRQNRAPASIVLLRFMEHVRGE